MWQELIDRILPNAADLANRRSDVEKLDIDKLKNVATNLNNLKGTVDKLDVNKLINKSC